jgi:murein DD-endopeptidase MepM/ murein hydrolase activator NlpD
VVDDVGLSGVRRHPAPAVLLLTAIALFGLFACGGGVYHRVRPGDTLYRIGKAYGVPPETLAKVNRINDPSRIYVGQKVFIPEADRELPVDVITPVKAAPRESAGVRSDTEVPVGRPVLDWPVAGGNLSSRFGNRGASFHDGIDITAPVGTPVSAAYDGVVIYSDVLRGYGNVIIVRHAQGYATVYAHNQRNLVRSDARVRRGQVIAYVGVSGRTSGPNLHFEVRHNNVARDPLPLLPARDRALASAGGRLMKRKADLAMLPPF